MAKDTSIPVSEWMKIRNQIAHKLKVEGSQQQQRATREQIAEALIAAGYIDIAFVMEDMRPNQPAKVMRAAYVDVTEGGRANG